jgi:hypothetical protein
MTSLCARAHAPQLGCACCEISQDTAVVSDDAHKHERCPVAAKPTPPPACWATLPHMRAVLPRLSVATHAHADAAQASEAHPPQACRRCLGRKARPLSRQTPVHRPPPPLALGCAMGCGTAYPMQPAHVRGARSTVCALPVANSRTSRNSSGGAMFR